MERFTGWPVEYLKGKKRSNPKAYLNSMLNGNQKIRQFSFLEEEKTVIAMIDNLSGEDVSEITEKFREQTGFDLEVKGQISLF